MIFYLCFITNCELNGYVYILEIVLDILNKLIHDSQNICRFMTLNAMHSKLISLIICLINDNLTNTLSTPPPVRKKTILYIARLITLCTSTETSFYYKFRLKSFTCLRHQTDITVVLLSCGNFFKY